MKRDALIESAKAALRATVRGGVELAARPAECAGSALTVRGDGRDLLRRLRAARKAGRRFPLNPLEAQLVLEAQELEIS